MEELVMYVQKFLEFLNEFINTIKDFVSKAQSGSN